MGASPLAAGVAWAAIGVNACLCLLNVAIAFASGSLAVAAEMVHNLVDLVASVAVLAGVRISERKSRAFPYGLYKVENLVGLKIDTVIVLEDLPGRGPAYVFSDAGVEVRLTEGASLVQALAAAGGPCPGGGGRLSHR